MCPPAESQYKPPKHYPGCNLLTKCVLAGFRHKPLLNELNFLVSKAGNIAASAINFHPHAAGQQSPTINPMVMFAPTETVIILIESICWTIGIFVFANSSTNYMRFGREGQHPIRPFFPPLELKWKSRGEINLSFCFRLDDENNSQNGWLGTGIADNWLFPPEQLLIKCEDENWTLFCLFRAWLSAARDLKVVFLIVKLREKEITVIREWMNVILSSRLRLNSTKRKSQSHRTYLSTSLNF